MEQIVLGVGQEVRAVALDISKAFDKVWHDGLLSKLKGMGVSGVLLSWFASYLSDRKQRVCVNGSYSAFLPIEAGVPQGSVLGPILFLVFINDLFDKVKNNLDVFADDSTLWAVVPSVSVEDRARVALSLNEDLVAIQDWAATWKVTYNHTKTELVTVSKRRDVLEFRKNGLHSCKKCKKVCSKKGSYLDSPTVCPHPPLFFYGKPIPERPKVKIVGLTISDNLNWKTHINNIAHKAAWAVSYLRRASRIVSSKALATIYKSHIRSVMEYACPIWMGGPKESLDRLDRVQAKAVKLIGAEHSLNIQELAHRRAVAGFCVMHRLVHRAAPVALHDLCPARPTTQLRRSARHSNSHTTNIDFFIPNPYNMPATWTRSMVPLFTTAWNRRLSPDLQRLESLQIFKSEVNSKYSLEDLGYNYSKHT
jgi:hypothetical protein